jgi:hypothetical protein
MRPLTLILVLLCTACAPAPAAQEPASAPIDVRAPTDPPPTPAAHLACAVDADCVRVFRRCGTCDCGAPLARAFVDADAAERDARCRDAVGPVCEMDCRATTPRCVASRCELAGAAASSPR